MSMITLGKHTLALALVACTTPLLAHHSVLVFETTTPIVLKGEISSVYWGNPHSSILVDVMDADGGTVQWAVENSGTLAATQHRGFDDSALQVGAPITACGYAPQQAYPSREELAARDNPPRVPDWWGGVNKVITGRLLVLSSGPAEHWSHYGPLDVCQQLLGVPVNTSE